MLGVKRLETLDAFLREGKRSNGVMIKCTQQRWWTNSQQWYIWFLDITIAKGAAPYDISAEITIITHKFLEHKLWSVHFWLFWPKILNLGPYKEHDEETWEMGAHRKDLHWSSLETLAPPRTLSLAPLSLATVRRTQHSPLLGRE